MNHSEYIHIGLSWVLFLFIFLVCQWCVVCLDECSTTTCGSYGPPVRFPFRIKGKQPVHCGYPEVGFDLSCSEEDDTVLELSTSWKLFVLDIDYESQIIYARDSEGCLLRQFLNFNLSSTKFQFKTEHNNFTLFNCSSGFFSDPISWSSDLHYQVYAIDSDTSIDNNRFISCTKMHDTSSLPYDYGGCSGSVSPCPSGFGCPSSYVPYESDYRRCDGCPSFPPCGYHYCGCYGSTSFHLPCPYYYGNSVAQLSWSNPTCTSCEKNLKHCRLKGNSTLSETECYGMPIPTEGQPNIYVEPKKIYIYESKKFIVTSVILSSVVLTVSVIVFYCVRIFRRIEREFQAKIERFLNDYKSRKPTRYSYADIKRITNQFKDVLGRGAYGAVYKGKLSDEILVAVKVLNSSTRNGEEFVNEVGTIGRIHHANVVRLVGFCADGFRRALVYEYLSNDTLQKFISSAESKNHLLGWSRQQDIALGIAKGIEYLHQGCDQRIVHFDIKPQNILLDQDFNPKVADFGLAKLCAKDKSAVSMTTARGTIGYIAPEVFSRNFGSVSYKSDVYSFGMLVLEIVGGRKITEETEGSEDQIYFPEWVYNLLEEGEDLRLEIEEEEDAKIAKKLAIVGLWCIQWNPTDRPSMSTVVQMLEGEEDNLPIPPNPFKSAVPSTTRLNARIPRRQIHHQLEAISETE